MALARTFDMRYGIFKPLLSLLGAGPESSRVELDDDVLRVRMGWAFRATIPRTSIMDARPYSRPVASIGVHGWRGKWLVNGAASGLVMLELEPRARGYVLGVPVRLRRLLVSMKAPDDLLAALG
ncbi:MAG TPA: hypothetical protein VL337_04420 [Acidimicrobiales bacterium]|jgi:hypothetical protein|nr:hypothetical protein [Acidimicrobiales bacterium]